MEFEWDEAKRQANFEKHRIDFEDAVTIYEDYVCTAADTRADYGEDRYVSIGLLAGVEIVIVYTPRGDGRRIISARRARVAERRKYHEERAKNEDRS